MGTKYNLLITLKVYLFMPLKMKCIDDVFFYKMYTMSNILSRATSLGAPLYGGVRT